MRKIGVVLVAVLLSSGPALAGPGADFADFASELRGEAQMRAGDAASRPAAPADPIDIEDPFYFELEQFSVDAMRLSRALTETGGPEDLQCIFRGMSRDAEARLGALNEADSAGEQARIYRAIADLMRDASEIAPAADDGALGASMPLPTCSAG
ncbi:hypothetical protein [Maricaulis sp.]|uniref:hypothetical protein n=1 Tax=Maricaulis sp. TaxID=1486257 RepID=UPI0026200A23|nr:hypothetical protein [Maricaulis sp.]